MHTLREEPRVVLLSRTHPLVEHDQLTVEDVVGQTFVGVDPSVDSDWGGFWSLDDYRGSPAVRTRDHAKNAQEMLAALASAEAITTAPGSVAAMLLTDLSGITAIPLTDASPAVITLSGHADRNNSLVAEVLTFAQGLNVIPGVQVQA